MAQSKHPGVTLVAPNDDGRASWRATWIDPDPRKRRWLTLHPDDARNQETRQAWAKKKAREIRDRRLDLETGDTPSTGVAVHDAIERFMQSKKRRPKTERDYRAALAKFQAWADASRFRSTADLTRGRLMAFSETIVNETKGTPEGKRGEYRKTGEPRSAYAVNRELAPVRTFLLWAVDADLMPRASKDDISRALRLLPLPKRKRVFLKPNALQKLFEAALRFDDGRGEPHAAPFAMVLVFTGLRLGEARTLRWSQVDLDAVDASGKAVGEINITIASKTHTERDVPLSVSPAVRRLLGALKLRTGGEGLVFGNDGETHWQNVMKAVRKHGAPHAFTWQALRTTTGTFLVNAPGIPFDAWATARQLGHSLAVAERHYLNRYHGIDPEARTLEAAMQIEGLANEIVDAVSSGDRTAVLRVQRL